MTTDTKCHQALNMTSENAVIAEHIRTPASVAPSRRFDPVSSHRLKSGECHHSVTVPLANSTLVAIIDAPDWPLVSAHLWRVQQNADNLFYAATTIKRTTVYMHRLILGLAIGDRRRTDHRNHNGLDNRRSNLRLATAKQNQCNQRPIRNKLSRFKGVSCDPRHKKKWVAHIRINGRQTTIGAFLTEEEAAIAYDEKARQHHGEFAYLNFPQLAQKRERA